MVDANIFVGSLNPSLNATPETISEEMQKHNAGLGILTHFTGHFYNFLEGNQLLQQILKKRRNLFGYLSANPYYVQHSISDMRKHLSNDKFLALHFSPTYWDMGWEEEPVKEILNAYRRFAKPLVCSFPSQQFPVAERLSKEFSSMRFLLLNVKSEEWGEAIKLGKDCPNIFLEVSPYLLPQDIKKACELLGAHRLIMGSDYPYFPFPAIIWIIEAGGISQREITLITSENARKFFPIEEER